MLPKMVQDFPRLTVSFPSGNILVFVAFIFLTGLLSFRKPKYTNGCCLI